MSTPVTQTLLAQSLYQGTVYTTPMAWTPGANSALLQCNLVTADLQNPSNKLTMHIEASTDGGKSYEEVASSAWSGGQLDKDGVSPLVPKIPADYTSSPAKPDFVRGRLELPATLSVGVSGTI